MARMEELNLQCMKCIEEANRGFGVFTPSRCQFCKVGQEIRRLEELSSSEWNKVNWTDSRFEDFYHG